MVPVAYFAPASAARPFFLTPAPFAVSANSAFHCSNPAALLPHADWATLVRRQEATTPAAAINFPSAKNAMSLSQDFLQNRVDEPRQLG